jgi:hypothetical protein
MVGRHRRSGELDVFLSCGGSVWHKWWGPTSGWHAWGSIGGPASILAQPAAAGRASGELDVVVTDSGSRVWHRWWSPSSGWHAWGSLGVPPNSSGCLRPAGAGARVAGYLDIVATNCDGTVWHKWWGPASGWSGWGSLGDPVPVYAGATTTAVGRAGGQLDILTEDIYGLVSHKWWG